MKSKKIAAVLLICFMGSAGFAEGVKVFYNAGNSSVLAGRITNDIPLAEQVQLVRGIIAPRTSSYTTPHVMVAHSQGGLRALGYAAQVGNQNGLKAVITVDAPVRGISFLKDNPILPWQDNGITTFTLKLKDFENRLARGITYLGRLGPGYVPYLGAILGGGYTFANLSTLLDAYGGNISGTFSKNRQVLRDMTADSDYIKSFEPATQAGYINTTSRRVYFTYYVLAWKFSRYIWPKIPVYVPVWEPRQASYVVYDTNWVPPTTTKRIPGSVYLGYIRGIDNDPVNLASDGLNPVTKEVLKKPGEAKNWGAIAANPAGDFSIDEFQNGKIILDAMCYANMGISTLVSGVATVPILSVLANADILLTSYTVINMKAEMARVLGSDKNDAFLLDYDMYRNDGDVGGTNISIYGYDSSTPQVQVNHASALFSDNRVYQNGGAAFASERQRIWGPNGRWGDARSGGLVKDWMENRYLTVQENIFAE